MTQEEKAKAYDDLLVKLQKAKEDNNVCDERYCCVIDDIVPELKESEDEKTRKALIDFFSEPGRKEYILNGFTVDDILAWLEKQGEQKPAAWSEEDEAIYYGVIETEHYMLDVVNGVKVFDVGNESIKVECQRELDWLKNLKDRVQPKQKWSKEDEKNLEGVIDEIDANKNSAPDYDIATYDRFLSWLKSLKDRYAWKPSEEQLIELSKIVCDRICSFDKAVLKNLYNDLKKLKES